MFILHFTNAQENAEYVVFTNEPPQNHTDSADPGYKLEQTITVMEMSGSLSGLPTERSLHPQ